jgi:hypothetical protein
MPFPNTSLKFRKIRNRFGLSAHRVVVRRRLPWYWYATVVGLALSLVAALLWLFLQRSGLSDAQSELASLRQQVREMGDELLLLRSTTGTEQNAIQMERATSQQLNSRVRALEAENAALKEDLLLFERLAHPAGGESSIRVEGLKVVPDGPRHHRYRILLAFQPGKGQPEFRGRLLLLVVFSESGQFKELTIPGGKEGSGEFNVEIRSILRKEGRFEVPGGAILQSVEVRVYQGDTLKAKRLAQL